ncbi:uncharacterized protein IL334_006887 [Kwoniella shivajii]|uniref:Uncharacterized protein n=1 Tax=Kwoniella shivajii TaxID=564305 RepID=A0ABZ1D777_9TREE|nr:hypothetical protein IL334_006887 [Kwoniella shivajii]
MSPVAVFDQPTVPSPSPKILATDIPRRPSPWHEIAHSLSTTSLPRKPRRSSSSTCSISPSTPPDVSGDSTPPLSTSQALREWNEKLSHPQSDVQRHQLIQAQKSWTTPKLAAERDKAGYIEYKLKLIDPTSERFERLVTQMMWRLKQGKNEAIYELGLADDGTVVGLPRLEMDASLRTLELMASEVGATVIILKEIVLHSSRSDLDPLQSLSPDGSLTCQDNRHDRPSNVDKHSVGAGRGRQSRRRRKYTPKDIGIYGGTVPKKLIFDPVDLAAASGSDDEEDGNVHIEERSADEDVLPFLFDLDTEYEPSNPYPMCKSPSTSPHHPDQSSPTRYDKDKCGTQKNSKKRRKSAAKSEARRLDLLRGDGTNPMWTELTSSSATAVSTNTSDTDSLQPCNNTDAPIFTLPHQPLRPSSLRLATPSTEESFLDDLLHIPLDSLSLSFADVRTISEEDEEEEDPVPILTSEDTQVSPSDESAEVHEARVDELICVEALVVRKVQHDEDDEVDEEAEEWSYGGEEDVWGFGGDD